MFSGQIYFQPSHSPTDKAHTNLTCCIDEHLHLRSLTLEDTHRLFALTDANRSYLRQWLPWLDSVLAPEDTRHFIEQGLVKMQAGQEFTSAICYDQTIVGVVGLHNISEGNRSGSIGYWLSATHQGKGIMTRACQAMMDYGFATLRLNRIDLCCAVGNARSEAIAKRLGLTYEGTLRETEWLYDHFVDWKVYAMLSSEWRARANKQP